MTDALVKGYTQQATAAISGDGQYNAIRATRDGKLMTASAWKLDYVLRGMAFGVSVGGIAAGADIALITGGGAGTVIDTDEPEMIVQTPDTHYHVPLGFMAAIQADPDSDADEQNIILFADRTISAIVGTATATGKTAVPLLEGGVGSVSTIWTAVTAAITDPVCDLILSFATSQAAQIAADGTVIHVLRADWEPSFPIFLKGPAAVVACWGGTAAVQGACTYYWAEVPLNQVS